MRFKYKDKIYETPNIDKKLKRMKITLDDIEILEDIIKENEDTRPEWKIKGLIKHCWINKENKTSIWGFHYNSELPKSKDNSWLYIDNVENYGYGIRTYKEFLEECFRRNNQYFKQF